MAQLFPPRVNVIVRTVLVAAAYCGVAFPFLIWAFARTPAATGQYRAYGQPVPFANNLHVSVLRIDCRYCQCHRAPERYIAIGERTPAGWHRAISIAAEPWSQRSTFSTRRERCRCKVGGRI